MCIPVLLSLSGDMYENGMDKGRFYSVNVPLKDGIDDLSMTLCVCVCVCVFACVPHQCTFWIYSF